MGGNGRQWEGVVFIFKEWEGVERSGKEWEGVGGHDLPAKRTGRRHLICALLVYNLTKIRMFLD